MFTHQKAFAVCASLILTAGPVTAPPIELSIPAQEPISAAAVEATYVESLGSADVVLSERPRDSSAGVSSAPSLANAWSGPETISRQALPSRAPQPDIEGGSVPRPTPVPAPTIAPVPVLVPGGSAPGPAQGTPQAPTSGLAPAPILSASFAGATTIYYDVWGNSSDQIIASMNAHGPAAVGYAVPNGIAFTWFQWAGSVEATTTTGTDGACLIDTISVPHTLKVYLPRWRSDAASPGLISWWYGAFENIRRHEAEHDRIWMANLPNLPGSARGQSCANIPTAHFAWHSAVQVQQASWEAADLPLRFAWHP